jgi:hypothetical protein
MEGISIVQFYQDNFVKPIKEVMTNLTAIRKIIVLFGETACRMYGLIIQKNMTEVLGM